jgi:hypothetical protein
MGVMWGQIAEAVGFIFLKKNFCDVIRTSEECGRRRKQIIGKSVVNRNGGGRVESKPRDLGSDRGYSSARIMRQDAAGGRSKPRPYKSGGWQRTLLVGAERLEGEVD